MKIYEVTLGADREWFSTKQGALSAIKELKATCPEMGKPEMQTLEVDPSKKGIVAILNKVAPTINPVAPEETKGAIRVTANKPPVPMSEEEINQMKSWGDS